MPNSGNRGSGQDESRDKKDHSGDTGRTSNQGRKEASGGSKETNNQGHGKGNTRSSKDRK
jgi:hypothetical protein